MAKPSARLSALPDSGELLLCGDKKRAHAEEIQAALVGIARKAAGRNPEPTYGIIDLQSVKAAGSGEERGIRGGKKIKGRNRRIAVGALGNVLAIAAHRANLRDTKAQPHGGKACG